MEGISSSAPLHSPKGSQDHEQSDGIHIPRKEKVRLAKNQIKQREAELKVLKERLHFIRGTLKKNEPAHHADFSLGKWKWHNKSKPHIQVRLETYLEEVQLQHDISVQSFELKQLKNYVKHPLRRGVEKTASALLFGRMHYIGLKPKTAARPILPQVATSGGASQASANLPTPWAWYRIAEGLLFTIASFRDAAISIDRSRLLKGLMKDGAERLGEIEAQKLRTNSNPAEFQALLEEEKFTKEVIRKVQEELEKTPVVENMGLAAFTFLVSAFDGLRITYVISTSLPALIQMGQFANVAAFVGVAASVATVPIAAVLTSLGAASTINNFYSCVKDLLLVRGHRDKKLEAYRLDLEALDPIINKAPDSVGAILVQANDEIQQTRRLLNSVKRAAIEHKQKENQPSLKSLEMAYSSQIEEIQDRCERDLIQLMETAPHEADEIQKILKQIQTRRTAAQSALILQDSIIPYIQQKATTKLILTLIRGAFDCISLSATALGVAGFSLTVAGGAGLPLLAVAGSLGMLGMYGQVGCSFLVKRLRLMQLNVQGKRLHTDQFNDAMLKRLKEEVQQWDALQQEGLADKTVASIMFEVLKKNYYIMPEGWGPKEWAESLVNNGPTSADRARYKQALMNVESHDTFAALRKVVLWPGRKIFRRWSKLPKTAADAA